MKGRTTARNTQDKANNDAAPSSAAPSMQKIHCWQLCRIRDLTERTGQRNPTSKPGVDFQYVDVSAVSNTSFRITSSAKLDGAEAPSRARKIIRTDDVLFATVRPTLKRVARVPACLHDQIASTGFIVLRAKKDRLESGYLYFLLLTDQFISRMGELERGASYPAVRDSDVLNEEIPLPPLQEQRRIAAVLGLVHRAVEQQERLLTLVAELKQTLLQYLFTNGLRGEPRKSTELGFIPQSWEVKTLASLLDIKHGYAFAGKFFAPSGRYVLLTPGHFYEAGGFRNQKDKTKYFVGEFPQDYILSKGDLLVAMTEQKAGLLGSAIIVPESDKFLHNQRLGLIQNLNEKQLKKHFLFYFFNTAVVRKQIFLTSSGSKVRHTSPGKIRELNIALPSPSEQQEIIDVLQTIDAKLEITDRKHTALTSLFRTLLHQLMTAQIRVADLDLSELETLLKKADA